MIPEPRDAPLLRDAHPSKTLQAGHGLLAGAAGRRRRDLLRLARDAGACAGRGLSCGHRDGAEAARHRVDAVAATTSRAEHRVPRLGPNGLKFEKETTHDLV